MTQSILVIGATDCTGRGAVRNLPGFLGERLDKYKIIGLTNTKTNAEALGLTTLPQVEVIEKDWTSIDVAWLKEKEVVRAFVSRPALAVDFQDEFDLYVRMMKAGVKYVVREAAIPSFIEPRSLITFGRVHWALENCLGAPEFETLQWTSLRPNANALRTLSVSADWLRRCKAGDNTSELLIYLDENVPTAIVDPEDVGMVAAKLLSLEDPSSHNHAKYNVSGPEDVTGAQLVQLMQEYTGVKPQSVRYRATGFMVEMISQWMRPKEWNIVLDSIVDKLWKGEASLANAGTSAEVKKFGLQFRSAKSILEAFMLKQ